MAGATGDKTGFSRALGAPTNLPFKPGTLELKGFVKRRSSTPPFEYRITAAGRRALWDNSVPKTYWFFNTDESEAPGREAHAEAPIQVQVSGLRPPYSSPTKRRWLVRR